MNGVSHSCGCFTSHLLVCRNKIRRIAEADSVCDLRYRFVGHIKLLLGYVSIIKETAKLFDIPVLGLYEKLGIDPTLPEVKEKYTSDGLHFNDAGHHVIAERLGEFLLSL